MKSCEKPSLTSSLYLRLLICILGAAFSLYLTIENQNELTELRLKLPPLSKEVKHLQEENNRLQYEIDLYESPIHMMELSRKPEFSHLKFVSTNEVIILPEKDPQMLLKGKKHE